MPDYVKPVSSLTDEELVRSVALEIMEWHLSTNGCYWLKVPDDDDRSMANVCCWVKLWNPLTDPRAWNEVRMKAIEHDYPGWTTGVLREDFFRCCLESWLAAARSRAK